MSETRENQVLEAETEKITKVKQAINLLKNKKSKFLFFVTKTVNPSASIYEVYFHANVLKKMGYNVQMLTDANDYEIPYWIDEEMTKLEHESMETVKLNVGPQDVLVIPDIFSNVMEQTKNLPCIRVGLLQSIDYMMAGLIPASDWSLFGVNNIITTSKTVKGFVEEFFGVNKFKIDTYRVSIPPYFTDAKEPKKPVVSVVGRNPNEVSKVIKLFYNKYPQYAWVSFDAMVTDSKPPRALRRTEFADRLSKNFATVWIDRISTFGTVGLEAMACGSIPIALVPDMQPEYLFDTDENGAKKYIENSGVWTNDFYSLPTLIGQTISKFLDDTIDEEVYPIMSNIASEYSEENSENDLKGIYQNIIDERVNVLQSGIDEFEKNKNKEEETKTEK
jgi:hypothetical protein